MAQPDNLSTEGTTTKQDPFWTPSNVVSLLRVPLTAIVVWLIWMGPDYRWIMFGVVLSMIATDVGDGHLARMRGEITQWGKILDPLADKVAIVSITLVLVALRGLPLWVGIAVVGRDVLIVLAGVFLVTRQHTVLQSNVWGKLTSIVVSALLLAYAMGADVLKDPLLTGTAILLCLSLISYGLRLKRFLRS